MEAVATRIITGSKLGDNKGLKGYNERGKVVYQYFLGFGVSYPCPLLS